MPYSDYSLQLNPAALVRTREARKLSQLALAAAIDSTTGAIARLEAGVIAPSLPTIAALSIALDVPLEELAQASDTPPPPDLSPAQLDRLAVLAGVLP